MGQREFRGISRHTRGLSQVLFEGKKDKNKPWS